MFSTVRGIVIKRIRLAKICRASIGELPSAKKLDCLVDPALSRSQTLNLPFAIACHRSSSLYPSMRGYWKNIGHQGEDFKLSH
jgi:hypothetical protein